MNKYYGEICVVIFLVIVLFVYNDLLLDYVGLLWVNPIASKFISNEWWIVLTCSILILLYYIKQFLCLKRINKWRISAIVVFIVICILCFCSDRWNYSMILKSNYIAWSHILIIIPILCEIILVLKIASTKLVPNNPELEIEKVEEVEDTYGRKEFCETTYNFLKTCYYKDKSFAVSITGQWGTGKTTFMNILKDHYKKNSNVSVIKFEPWKSDSTNGIIKNFFTLFRNELSIYIPNISLEFNEYIDFLLDDKSTTLVKLSSNLLHKCFNSSSDKVEKIKEKLKETQHKTVVFIDDLDRLDSSEIKEVLRLMRNTADFPYVQFIVTLDKQYVCDRLKADGVNNPVLYMEKFFNTEISLPKFEERIICDEVQNRISKTIHDIWKIPENDIKITEMIYYRISNADNDYLRSLLIPQILHTMRDVIRFNNSFKIISKTYKDIAKEINFQDLFYIELLHYRYPNIYSELRNNPLSILDLKKDYYFLKTNQLNSIIRDLCINNENAKVAEEILSYLFLHNKNSISKVRDFDKYFMYRLDEQRLTISEFLDLEGVSDDLFDYKVDKLYESKYASEFMALIPEILDLIIVKSKEVDGILFYERVYKIIRLILTKSKDDNLKTEVASIVIEHIKNSRHVDNKHLEAKLELFNFISFKTFHIEEQTLLKLFSSILFRDNLELKLQKKVGEEEIAIIRNFLSANYNVEYKRSALEKFIIIVEQAKENTKDGLIISIDELKNILSSYIKK